MSYITSWDNNKSGLKNVIISDTRIVVVHLKLKQVINFEKIIASELLVH